MFSRPEMNGATRARVSKGLMSSGPVRRMHISVCNDRRVLRCVYRSKGAAAALDAGIDIVASAGIERNPSAIIRPNISSVIYDGRKKQRNGDDAH